jgi:hypothetical protein
MRQIIGQSTLARAFDFCNNGGNQVDIPAVRKLYPDLMNFDTWIEKEGKAK